MGAAGLFVNPMSRNQGYSSRLLNRIDVGRAHHVIRA
jgi:hypothetical protein